MKEAMLLYGVSLGKRYSRRQKNRFYAMMKPQWEQSGYKVSLQSYDSKLYHHYNIVIGELKQASTVVVCGYDTPMKAMRNARPYYPFHSEFNKQSAKRALGYQIGVSLLYFMPIVLLLWQFEDLNMLMQLSVLLLSGILLMLAYKVLKGSGNPVNFNRNSASLALVESLMKQQHPQVAYVLLDQSIDSFEGIKLLKEHLHKQKLIYLDCIAHGDTLVVAHGNGMKEEAKALQEAISIPILDRCYNALRLAQNSISIIPEMLYVASGEIVEKEFVVKNTGSKADTQVDMKRLEQLHQGISTYLKGVL